MEYRLTRARASLFALFLLPLAPGLAQSGSEAPVVCNRVRFFPAPGQERGMVGGKFSGSNVSATEGFVVLAEIKSAPKAGAWAELQFPNTKSYRWLRYEAPTSARGYAAEVEFYSGQRKLEGLRFGSRAVFLPGGRVSYWWTAFDVKTGTWVKSTDVNGQFAGIDLR